MTDTATPLETIEVQPEAPPPAPAPQRLPVEFTATGGEYFRIWVVNLLLTVVTLGIYSAWAKVRKTRYFWSNTRLGGSAFQYHGNPAAILRGRLLVGALLVAYSVAGRISIRAGVAAAVALGLLAPWLFVKAMRFKLSNTSWRGVRFGFQSSAGAAYRALGGAVVLWLWVTVAATRVVPSEPSSMAPLLLAYGVIFGVTPWLHARVKRYQHGATTFGALRFEMDGCVGALYGAYAKTLLLAVPSFVVLVAGMGGVMFATGGGKGMGGRAQLYGMMAVVYVVFLLGYAVAGAFLVARADRAIWSRTRGGPLRFSTSIATWPLMRVWLGNGVLTVLTLGLYWPFAAVNIARYRVACLTVEAAAPLDAIAAGAFVVEPSATGDGAVDLLGWDVGL
jgi:uncharacterized membrane protein YjgN (DUF898 family)